MMGVALYKVWRDLWNNKGRTVLVVLSISLGVLAVGMIVASNTLVSRQMSRAQKDSKPSSVVINLNGLIDDETVNSLAHLPDVGEVEGIALLSIRWKPTPNSEWQPTTLLARNNYHRQKIDLLELRAGVWPTSDTVAVEFNHVIPYNVPPIGSTIYFEVNDRPKAVTLGGTVRDAEQSPPPFAQQPVFYATREMLESLSGDADYAQVRFSVPDYTKAKADRVANRAKDRLKDLGVSVGYIRNQDPSRHLLQNTMDGVGLVLGVMAFVSLALSALLVINTMNALIAQQVTQIGIMKAVGGSSRQITTLYLAGVIIYCALSLAIAVPLGALGGEALAGWMLWLINVPTAPFEVLRVALIAQIVTGLLIPLFAALFPVMQGVAIPVRQAIYTNGAETGGYGSGWLDNLLGRIQGLHRIAALSLRNTFRSVGRVVLTESALIIAGAVFMMVISTHVSFSKTIDDSMTSFKADVIMIFKQPQRIEEAVSLIESRPGVAFAEMWLWDTAKARTTRLKEKSPEYEILLRGVPKDTKLFAPNLMAGRNFLFGDGRALLLNQKLASKMRVGVGDSIVIDLGDSRTTTWTVVGLVFDLISVEQNTAYFQRETLAAELNQVGRASVAEIKITKPTLAAQEKVEKDMRRFFKDQSMDVIWTDAMIRTKDQANAQLNILTTLLLIMTCLIALVGGAGLSGTLSINVLERRREIGVMRAVGASSLDIAFIFMGEGLMLAILSWVIAVPISFLVSPYFAEALSGVVESPITHSYAVVGALGWLLIVIILSLLASGLPARRATQISVRESLAYE